MTEIKLQLKETLTEEEVKRYQEILLALITCGGLSGVRSGQTIIHFDSYGTFMGVQLSYWPWQRRKALDKI